jgi:hypothetical protein
MQDRTLDLRRFRQFGQNARRQGPAAERTPVGVPLGDDGTQLNLLPRRLAWLGQPDRRQQQWLGGVGYQADHRGTAGHGGGQAKVEQRGTAGDMQCAAVGIADR